MPVNVPSELLQTYLPKPLPLGVIKLSDLEDAYLEALGLIDKGNQDKLSLGALLSVPPKLK